MNKQEFKEQIDLAYERGEIELEQYNNLIKDI